jgi:hypothetical protein
MSEQPQPCGVHLNGSIPLANAEEVFRMASSILGQRLRRIPDGETGVRLNWIGWQRAVFARHPAFELIPPDPKAYNALLPHFKLRPGGSSGKVVFDPLGYAEAALASYAVFSRLKQDNVIATSCRFQISLPTPLAPVRAFLVEEEQASVQPAYETAMFAELDTITSAIPHEELAIQWDVAIEFALLEGVAQALYEQTKTGVIEQLVRLGKHVPVDVELGYHLCYGDAGHKHFVEPKDTAKLVEVANGISAGLTRSLNWISLPVPRERSDEAYFAPLLNLHLHPETELYLGLVHFTDGIEGTQKRIEAAQRVVAQFGVATECGCGRRPSETISELLRLHREVAAPR